MTGNQPETGQNSPNFNHETPLGELVGGLVKTRGGQMVCTLDHLTASLWGSAALQSSFSSFTGAYAYGILNVDYPDLSVTDIAGAG